MRIIFDNEKRVGNKGNVSYNYSLCKEELVRKYVFARQGKFLDVGARDGFLTYLLGITSNMHRDDTLYRENKKKFDSKYEYYGMDLTAQGERILTGDICSLNFIDQNLINFFDVIYSNNVFEHLKKPWLAAVNLIKMIKPGGIIITIVPFSQRYHESPVDYFRYTHTGINSLFGENVRVLESGYDIQGRRNDWQGSGNANDIVPEDKFGAWRETWFTVSIVEKVR